MHESYGTWSVCLSVSVKSHLTSGASVRPENTVTYSVGNGGQKIGGFSLKPLRCRDPVLPPLTAIRTVSHFPAVSVHAHCSITKGHEYLNMVAPRVLHFSAFIIGMS